QSPTLAGNTFHLYAFANYEVDSSPMPVIAVQPTNQATSTNLTALFKVTASGARPFYYQWYKGDTILTGQTNRFLIISNITVNDLGSYYVTVSNNYGVATSATATLTFGPIANPGFETDIFNNYPGYVSGNQPITGWYGSDAARYGINPLFDVQAPFANNGVPPEGSQVAFLQSVTNAPQYLWTYIIGLTPGENYFVNFEVNCRDHNGTQPTFRVGVDNQLIGEARSRPVGGTNKYRTVAFPFVPTSDTVILSITNDFNGDSAILVDNFRVVKRTTSWSYDVWTNDLTSGVDSERGCSHAYNFGGAGFAVDTVINGIKFRGVPGPNPYVNNSFYVSNLISAYSSDVNTLTANGGGSALLAQSFIYYSGIIPDGIAPTIKLTNLIPGIGYELTIFGVGFDAKTNTRSSTFVCGNDMLTINEDAFNIDNGIRVKYRYVADETGSITVSYYQVDNNDSFHTYGFINQEVNSTRPPSFYRQPVGRTIAGGSTLVLDALVGGQTPLYLQWQKDG
ncbi:MAG TPA: immunoglobulin domain-containing protein, partial [Verrucomicrobiota bacterium]|nr:immunoglobulin domain-containing protein [Verrucomicrobiota bacterium]